MLWLTVTELKRPIRRQLFLVGVHSSCLKRSKLPVQLHGINVQLLMCPCRGFFSLSALVWGKGVMDILRNMLNICKHCCPCFIGSCSQAQSLTWLNWLLSDLTLPNWKRSCTFMRTSWYILSGKARKETSSMDTTKWFHGRWICMLLFFVDIVQIIFFISQQTHNNMIYHTHCMIRHVSCSLFQNNNLFQTIQISAL